jgi:hypothetical protein
MRQTLLTLLLGLAGLALTSAPAAATSTCAVRSTIVGQLADRYSETRRGIGMTGNNAVVEVFASDAGTWTVTVTLPSGMTCLVASGSNWEDLAEKLPVRGDPV